MPNPFDTVRQYLIAQLSPATTATVTVANGTATTLTVSVEGEFVAGQQLLIESEQIYVTAATSDASKEITAVRSDNGTTGAAHTAKTAKIINVFYPRFPDDYDAPAQKCVAFFIVGGVGNPHIIPLRKPAFQFECYGPTQAAVLELNESLRTALQGQNNMSANSQVIKYAKEETEGQLFMNENGEGRGWAYMMSRY